MRFTVYLDLLFLMNLCMDVWILFVSGTILGKMPIAMTGGIPGRKTILRTKRLWARYVGGGAVGAIWVCLIAICAIPEWLEQVLSLGPIAFLMQKISFSPSCKSESVKNLAVLYGVSFLIGGFLTSVTGIIGSLSFMITFPLALFAGFLMIVAAAWLRARQERRLCRVRLLWRGISLELTGLIDTGNSLHTPKEGSPVHVISAEAASSWMNQPMDSILWIPYQSVGRHEGTLPAIAIDEMCIDGSIVCRNPVIAFSKYPVSSDGSYQILLHPQEAFK